MSTQCNTLGDKAENVAQQGKYNAIVENADVE